MHSKPCAAYDEPPIVPGYLRTSVVKIYGDKWGGNHSDPRPYTSGTTPGTTEELITVNKGCNRFGAHLFRSDHNLPSTNGGFFFSLICNCILRYIEKEMPECIVGQLSSFDELPLQLVSPFSSICNLALDGIIKDKILFSSKDLIADDLAIEKPLGLLQVVQSLVSCGRSLTCNFPHLSVQEYLAAYCISQIPNESKRCNTMKAITNEDRFSAVLHFFASITKLKTECDVSLFKKFLPLCNEYIDHIGSTMLQRPPLREMALD